MAMITVTTSTMTTRVTTMITPTTKTITYSFQIRWMKLFVGVPGKVSVLCQ